MPLPFRDDSVELPYNRKLAETRLGHLKRRFERDMKYKEDYISFIRDMIKNGYAERAPKTGVVYPTSWGIPSKEAGQDQGCVRLLS